MLPDHLSYTLVHPAARAPVRSRPGDAGLDLHAAEAAEIAPGARALVATGVAIALPPGACALVVPRSGLGARHGVLPVTGLIDPNFRGGIGVTLLNTGDEPYRAEPGDRIAQLLLLPIWAPQLALTEALPAAGDDRGTAGWGSSGT